MKNFPLLLIFLLLPSISLASVDESKSDVYFANGVDTEEWQAWNTLNKVVEATIKQEIYNNDTAQMDKQIGKFDLLYNQTSGSALVDLIEAALQKVPFIKKGVKS